MHSTNLYARRDDCIDAWAHVSQETHGASTAVAYIIVFPGQLCAAQMQPHIVQSHPGLPRTRSLPGEFSRETSLNGPESPQRARKNTAISRPISTPVDTAVDNAQNVC